MDSTPGGGLVARRVAWLLGIVLQLSFLGCKRAPPAPAPEDPVERAAKAAVLYRRAQAAPIPEKFELYRRLTALYDDTAPGRDGYLELVVALTRDRPPQPAEALKVAKTFRERHPTDERVGEAFRDVADTAYGTKDDTTRRDALGAWEEHLAERDVAGDLPKRIVFTDLVRLRLRQERWEDAEVAIDTALAEPAISGAGRVELLVRKGSLLSAKLGRHDDGRRAFEQALELARELRAKEVPQPGIPPEQIEAELKKLDGG